MGKTVPSYRMALENEIWDWSSSFAKGLNSKQDIEAFEQMLDSARNYAMAVGNACRPVVFEAMAMSIILFQQKKISSLEKDLEKLKRFYCESRS